MSRVCFTPSNRLADPIDMEFYTPSAAKRFFATLLEAGIRGLYVLDVPDEPPTIKTI